MVRVADEDLLGELATKPLAKLAASLGINVGKWLEVAASPLPVTMRLTPGRHDADWTRDKLRSVGGKPIDWMPDTEAWVMPFSKGDMPDAQTKKLMILLHETGRITRQEAVSMIPPVILEPIDGQLVLDTCAAPGSKATQLAEAVPNGLVLANEPSSGRLNMLVTNRGRLGLTNMLITQHDGRHYGRIASPGVDSIVVDAPCTGTATTRKNKELWWKWTPKEGRSLFRLQTDIAYRAAQLLIPGGRMVYSTCSLDPTENEAAVCEILRRAPWLKLVNIESDRLLPGLIVHRGINDWPILDQEVNPVEWTGELPKLPGLSENMLNPSQRGEEAPPMDYTIRVHQHDNDTGGFYIALFEHDAMRTPEGVCRSMILKRELMREPQVMERQKPNRHTSLPAEQETIDAICNRWGLNSEDFSWWQRGKRINLSSKMATDRLYTPKVKNSKGDFWPGDSFHPLRVIHVGQPTFVDNKGNWRPRQEALELLRPHLKSGMVDVELETIISMLNGEVLTVEDFPVKMESGSSILRCGQYLCPVWVAARVSFMMDDYARDILRMKIGIEERGEEE